jgi:tRNA-specific 2-thiouridylase
MNFKKTKKVIVAMSGGLDSSVAAALLKRAGFDVVGVFMKFWSPTTSGGGLAKVENRCCSSESERRARKVAKILKIPFYVFNFEKEFKKRIVDYFLKEHKKGKTPNPCVICNKEIKFGLLLEKALALDADFVATGHYGRLRRADRNFKLLRAQDKEKDQSYFLWQLNQKQLKRILFPIGDYTRNEVEKLARKFKLPVLSARKSQEICFVLDDINDFLKKYLKEKTGKIITKEGKVIGKHEGLWFYTIGQRKGIKLPGGPYYVIAKDFKKNLLIVSKNEKDLAKKELITRNVNWISGKALALPLRVKAKIRYRTKAVPATLYKLGTKNYKLIFKKSQRAVTPGQSVVFYKGDELLGGGIIDK